MGASRESYKISFYWKWGGKTYREKIKTICKLLKGAIKYKDNRQMLIKDNITQPFDKLIGCKLFGHDFHYDSEDYEYLCHKCWKRVPEDKYNGMIRRRKIEKIKKKI